MKNVFVFKYNAATRLQCLAVVDHLTSCDACGKLATVNAAWVLKKDGYDLKKDGYDFKEAIASAMRLAHEYPKGIPDAFSDDDGGLICSKCFWLKTAAKNE